MTIIEQIKAEIERQQKENVNYDENGSFASYCDSSAWSALESILTFVSGFEKSEKPMNQEELDEEINRTYHDGSVTDTSDIDHVTYENIAEYFYNLGCRRTAEKYDELEYNRQRTEESEKPMNPEELEKEIEEYFPESTFNTGFNYDDLQEIARHFAKWGAEHLKK